MALLLAAAFLAGRFWPRPGQQVAQQPAQVNPQRIVLVAVGDHLERSQMLLLEIMHNDEQGATLISPLNNSWPATFWTTTISIA